MAERTAMTGSAVSGLAVSGSKESGPGANAVAVILARAGSKGVPGKNVAVVGGRPCIAWTIDAAQRSRAVGSVVVTTDDLRAREIARAMGCVVVDRPLALASDSATVDDAVRHAVGAISPCGERAKEDLPERAVVILYANVPVRPAGLIDRAVRLLVRSGCDSVQSYAPVGKHHPWWTVRIDAGEGDGTGSQADSGVVRPWEGEVLYHGVYRRQDLPAAHVPDGGVVAVTARSLFCELPGVAAGPHAFLGRDRRAVLTVEGEVVDIDSRVDLAVADAILRERRGEPSRSMTA